MSSDEKVVQTKLPQAEYERLRKVADEEGEPLKTVLREAIVAYTDSHVRPDPNDPVFTADPPHEDVEAVSAAKTDVYLYGDRSE